MATLTDSNVQHLRALWELITEHEKIAHPLLFLIHSSAIAHRDGRKQLDINGTYGEGLWLVRNKAQDLSICTRDWIAT